jgi:hypothetical protein
MNRRNWILAAGAATVAAAVPAKGAINDMDQFKEVFEASMKEKKGIMVYLHGQTVGGLVTRITPNAIELRNQQYSRIVVMMDKIEAVAMN